MTTLTVALPLFDAAVSTEFSYVLSDGRQVVLGQGVAPLALLPGADNLVLVVPARALSWHTVKLPPVSASRLRAALDGLLEDHLLDEPADLALAIEPRRGSAGTALVAVCNKNWLRAALQFFELAKRPASRVVPEFSPAGANAPECRLVITGTAQDAWMALIEPQGVICLPLLSAAVLAGAGMRGFDHEDVMAQPAVAELAEQMLARPVAIQPLAQSLLASGQSAWELAQFDLASSSGGRIARRSIKGWQQFLRASAWRPARWGLLALLVANLVGLNAWAWRQNADLQAKRELANRLLIQTFPKVTTVVNAPVQMERELARLRQSSGALSGRDLETMLEAVGTVLAAGQNPTAIDFLPGELSLRGLGQDASQAAVAAARTATPDYQARVDGERLVFRSVRAK